MVGEVKPFEFSKQKKIQVMSIVCLGFSRPASEAEPQSGQLVRPPFWLTLYMKACFLPFVLAFAGGFRKVTRGHALGR